MSDLLTIHVRVGGLSCPDCARKVRERLLALPEVFSAEVCGETGEVTIQSSRPWGRGELAALLEPLGYSVLHWQLGKAEAGTSVRASSAGLRVVVIGSGAAGVACAIQAAELGARVTVVEHSTLGGTCVNVGCIPSKILLEMGHIAHRARSHPFEGLSRAELGVDAAKLFGQLHQRVLELREAKYRRVLESYPGISVIQGKAFLTSSRCVRVERPEGTELLEADRILIATGSSPDAPPIPGLAGTPFWTSTEAVQAGQIPKDLIVLGGSAVGLELGQAFARLGSRVTVLEYQDRILPLEDEEVSRELQEILESQEGISFYTSFRTRRVQWKEDVFLLEGENGKIFVAEKLLVATGRRPNTAGMGLEELGIQTNARGAILVNDSLQTSVEGVYAAGDCAQLPQLVYVAAAAGTQAAFHMMGREGKLDLSVLPVVVFTDPQVASVGLSESQARALGIEVENRKLSLNQVPRALVAFQTKGFIKLVAERGSGRLLGGQIVAPGAGELITALGLALKKETTWQELARLLCPYLVMAEGLKLCAMTFRKDLATLSCCAG